MNTVIVNNSTQQTSHPKKAALSEIEKYLLAKKKEVEKHLAEIDEDDPVILNSEAEVLEPGTISWRAEAHFNMSALRSSLMELSMKIDQSLHNIQNGTYGICDKCGGDIDKDRLEAMPMATDCQQCF